MKADKAIASNDRTIEDNLSVSLSSKFFSTIKISNDNSNNLAEKKENKTATLPSKYLDNDIGESNVAYDQVDFNGNILKTKIVRNVGTVDEVTCIVTKINEIIINTEESSVITNMKASYSLLGDSDCTDGRNDLTIAHGISVTKVIEDEQSSPILKSYNNHVRYPPVSTGGTYSSDKTTSTNTETDELLHFESDVTLISQFHTPHNIDQSKTELDLKLDTDMNSLNIENIRYSQELSILQKELKTKTIQCKEANRYEYLFLSSVKLFQ